LIGTSQRASGISIYKQHICVFTLIKPIVFPLPKQLSRRDHWVSLFSHDVISGNGYSASGS
jgi:hypothetical protein